MEKLSEFHLLLIDQEAINHIEASSASSLAARASHYPDGKAPRALDMINKHGGREAGRINLPLQRDSEDSYSNT